MFNLEIMDLAEISDRMEIQQLVVDYATAIDQRRFWPDHDKADLMGGAKIDHRPVVCHVEIGQSGKIRNSGVARRSIEGIEHRGLRQLPCQRMFAATRSDQQDIHERSF